VPVIEGVAEIPSSDALKRFGTALASFGSVALFHMPGITAEDPAFAGPVPEKRPSGAPRSTPLWRTMLQPATSWTSSCSERRKLSLFEIERVAQAWGRPRIHPNTTVLVTASPEIKHAADRMGLTRRIEAAGAVVAEGICFYQSYAREMAEANAGSG
jgi:predicted aconitase